MRSISAEASRATGERVMQAHPRAGDCTGSRSVRHPQRGSGWVRGRPEQRGRRGRVGQHTVEEGDTFSQGGRVEAEGTRLPPDRLC